MANDNSSYRLSIKLKMFIFSSTIILIASFTIGLYFTNQFSTFTNNEIKVSNLNITRLINTQTNAIQNDLIEISNYLATDSNITSYILNKDSRLTTDYHGNFLPSPSINDTLINLAVNKEFIDMILLYYNDYEPPSFYILNEQNYEFLGNKELQSNHLGQRITKANGKPVWFSSPIDDTSILKSNYYHRIGIGRVVLNLNDYSKIGTLIITFNSTEFEKIYKDSIDALSEGILIISDKGEAISQYGMVDNIDVSKLFNTISDNSDLEGQFNQTLTTNDVMISYSRNNTNGWIVCHVMNLNTLKSKLTEMMTSSITAIVLSLLISIPCVFIISHYLLSPIKILLQSMKKFQKGNFDEQVEVTTNDEIGDLAQSYNLMVKEIKSLIEKNYLLQIKEKEAELDALQSQINPHFLYNTLDTIYWNAHSKNQKDIADMIYSLSKFFRLNLNRGKPLISVEKEFELTHHYLYLQKIRLKDKLLTNVSFDPKLNDYLIPKLVLQPIVENAFIHGFKNKSTVANLTLNGSIEMNHIIFTVCDNGQGIDQATLNKLNQPLSSLMDTNEAETSYAIQNIKSRLWIYYDNDFSLKYSSILNKGTTVTIKLPLEIKKQRR